MDLALIFFTGLTVGGITCLSLQGGLLASVLAVKSKSEERKQLHVVIGTIAFLVSKFFAHVTLGFLLGLFGKIITFSDTMQSVLQLIAGIYMIISASSFGCSSFASIFHHSTTEIFGKINKKSNKISKHICSCDSRRVYRLYSVRNDTCHGNVGGGKREWHDGRVDSGSVYSWDDAIVFRCRIYHFCIRIFV